MIKSTICSINRKVMPTEYRKMRNEVWKDVPMKKKDRPRGRTYAVSNMGRVMSYAENDGDKRILTGSSRGLPVVHIVVGGQRIKLLPHREIAKAFCERPSRSHKFVIHLDHQLGNNRADNLQWATKREMFEHENSSPARLAYFERQRSMRVGQKLDATKVRRIKRMLLKRGGRTMREIAQHFGISESGIYLIRSGQQWGHITV